MEAVRPKKQKAKSRSQSSAVREAPPIPARPAVVNGVRLPEVPNHAPVTSQVRASTPEPEEVVLSEDENSVVEQNEVILRIEHPQPVPNLIFPRSTSLLDTKNDERVSVHPKELEAACVESRPIVPAYPLVPELSSTLADNVYSSTRLPSYAEVNSGSQIASASKDAPPLYPELSRMVFAKTEHGLLAEEQLLTFYYNPLYETVDEFVDNFICGEEIPCGPLFPILQRLRDISDRLSISAVSEKENTSALSASLRECWISQQKTMDFKGRCLENKEGHGKVNYQTAVYSPLKGADLKKLLAANRTIMLDERLCNESQFKSLALQAQWVVISINHQFMAENSLSVRNSPCLFENIINTPGRQLLLAALSDLFYHLRAPLVPSRFGEAVRGWITELTCVLHMSCRTMDSQFLLNHILRLPSPIAEWAPCLVQNFIQAPCIAKLKVDYCITMLAHMMNPVRSRESFLSKLVQSEKEDSAWTILSEDEEQGEISLVTIDEADLTSLLEQLPVTELYSVAYLHFSATVPDRSSQFISIIAFQLILMKVLDQGLSTYSKPGYKQFCKQIGNALRQSVRELCSHWRVTRDVVTGEEGCQLQREVDRVVLLALQYLINRNSTGLWQFLVDLPYDCVSEECRNRCEYMLRSITKVNLKDLYDTPICEVNARIRSGSLQERTEQVGPLDAVFLVNAVSTIASHSHNDPTPFLKEIIEVCFCEESSRESLYKVGGEAVATLLARRPTCLDSLLTILDRNIDHMQQYAIHVLASSTLSVCRVSPAVLSIIGKWLINKSPNEPANRLARRVLSGLYWGLDSNGQQLWIDQKVHQICAEIVINSHSVHCSGSNGMIAKSIRQISKMASKLADHDQLFTQFCWDILIKLKLSKKDETSSQKPQTDLAAFYVDLTQSCITSPPVFLSRGVPLLSELVSSGSATACVVLLVRLMHLHHGNIADLAANKPFLDVFERILHVDQCSYAVQWMTGPSSTPTPIVRLVCSAIAYDSRRVPDVGVYLRAWVDLLCVQRPAIWNSDQVTLQILGALVRIAFLKDPKALLGIREVIHNLYTQMLATWRESSKGLFSFLSSDPPPPPLIAPSLYAVAPWATYLLLLVEAKAFPTFMQFVYEALVKKDKNTLEHAVKKASQKASLNLSIESVPLFRWASFVAVCGDSLVYPMALQRLATEAYRLRTVNGNKYQFARRMIDCASPAVATIMADCRKAISAHEDQKGFSKAVSGWLFTTREVSRTGFDFSQFDLDYLLQLILANDTNVWLDYVDMTGLQREDDTDQKLYAATCHLGCIEMPSTTGLTGVARSSPRSHAIPFPCLPSHPGLPPSPAIDANSVFQRHVIVSLTTPLIKHINTLAEDYVVGGEKMTLEDEKYCELLLKLYGNVSRNVPVTIRCGARCQQENNTETTVTAMEFCSAVDVQMTQNREKRSALWLELFAGIMDRMALDAASLEHIARQVSNMAATCPSAHRNGVQHSGRELLYLITSSLSGNEILFPSASAAYEHALRTLGQQFISNRAEEQIHVMRLVLDGFVLSDPLVESFTPECLSSTELCEAYTKMSEAVRSPERSPRALKLLGRLGIDRAAASLPPHQFAPLLPLAFSNLASQPDREAPLHKLCMQHVVSFVFHAFPANFGAGLDLALKGCNTGGTPVELLHSFVKQLAAESFEMPKSSYYLPGAKCQECVTILSRRLSDARSRLPVLYSIWGRYMDPLTRLAQLFLFTPVRESFQSDSPPAVVQRDLITLFGRVCSIWGPLIKPPSSSLPPFSPSHDMEAQLVLERYVDLLIALPHGAVLLPGSQNVPSLIWQYYFENLSSLTHGTAHYYSTLESSLVRVHWPSFWPSLRGLAALDECLASKSQDCASFVTQIVVRVPWKNVLQSHVPADLLSAYLATLCSVLARIISKRHFYSKVSASLLDVLKSLSLRPDWSAVTPDGAESVASTVACSLPHDSLTLPTEHVAVFQIIWRKICVFSPHQPFCSSAVLKQALWLRTECAILLRGGASGAVAPYNSLISDVQALASKHDNLRAFCTVVRELTAVWSRISDGKFGESLVTAWNAYLASNADSPLVLCCLNTVIGSLNGDQLTTGLKVMETTLRTYFKRPGSSWSEVLEWVQFPASSETAARQYLLTIPSSENGVQPQLLTLNVYLMYGSHSDDVYISLLNYICNTKPKHVTCDASFILVLRCLLSWLFRYSSHLPPSFAASDDHLQTLIRWLNKASRDESNFLSNLITSKKNAHSPRLRAILSILELYLAQQSLGEGRRPRCSEGAAVMNSRIHALKETANSKSFSQFSAAFNLATAFFTQIELHHLGSAPNLVLRSAQQLYKEQFLREL